MEFEAGFFFFFEGVAFLVPLIVKPSFSEQTWSFIYFSKVDWLKSVSDSWKFICAWALRVQGVDTGEISERVFLKSHLSELVISSQNLTFNSKAEIQKPNTLSSKQSSNFPPSQGIPGIRVLGWAGHFHQHKRDGWKCQGNSDYLP